MVAKNLPFGGSAGLIYRELFFYCFFGAAMIFVLGATTLWGFAEVIAPRIRRALRERASKRGSGGGSTRTPDTDGDGATHELLEVSPPHHHHHYAPSLSTGNLPLTFQQPYTTFFSTLQLGDVPDGGARTSSYVNATNATTAPPSTVTGAGATAPKKNEESRFAPNVQPRRSPSAMRLCPWRSWAVLVALFITFGGLFAFWIYMSLLGFTSDSWADMTTTWAFLVVWVLLAVATVAFPGTGEDDP